MLEKPYRAGACRINVSNELISTSSDEAGHMIGLQFPKMVVYFHRSYGVLRTHAIS